MSFPPKKCTMKSSPPSSKQFRCSTCQRSFTRIDHLKRHHLRHSGLKPYSCVFCSESFARCDNLRNHYPDCAKRGDQKIPETSQRGRRRHACQLCTLMKLRCDGGSPCSSCGKRNLECNNQRKHQTRSTGSMQGSSSPSTNREDLEQPLDRGSIKFLLNAGTDSFTERFHLPPRSDRARGLVYHNQRGLEDAVDAILPYNGKGDHTDAAPAFIEWDPTTLNLFEDTFKSLLQGPFGSLPELTEDPYPDGAAYHAIIPPGLDPNLTLPGEQAVYEPEKPFATALIQSILTRAWTVPLNTKAQDELSTNLNFLLTTARIQKFVTLYFKYWHTNSPMIHPPSFDVETVPLPLLASVVFMGAIYSNDERETCIAKRLLDFAELFVFSSDVFSYESEIAASFGDAIRSYNEDINSWTQFQNFQAGFIMIIVQYWAGSRVSRNRVMESRFGDLIKVSRRIGLLNSQHQSQDRIYEYLWIQKESRIRTINIISLMDCAFSFFQNFPCRLTHTEMKCEFPCEESLFNSPHPFAERNFCFTRGIRICDALQSLFDKHPIRELSAYSPTWNYANSNSIGLKVFDMFVLIHLLYTFIDTHMALLVHVTRADSSNSNSNTNYQRQHSTNGIIPGDNTTTTIRTALSRWRDIWVSLRSQLSCNEWVSMGFYKNGYNFWLVSQLLIAKKHSVDVVMRMEVNCEDKLQRLNVLLQDEWD